MPRAPLASDSQRVKFEYLDEMNVLKILSLLAMFPLAATSFSLSSLGWKLINTKIRNEFGDVPRVTTAELAERLKSRNPPLLLDVRTAPEYAVSHLVNAIRVDPSAGSDAVAAAKDREIITYCSVGYRSARFAQKLRAAHFTHVANLEGSIFAWANENRPLVRVTETVSVVHPYNEVWGKLLAPEHRARIDQ